MSDRADQRSRADQPGRSEQSNRPGEVPALALRGVTAGYERRAPVVRDVTLSVAAGEAVALLGPSGCGKSTLARVAALLHRPYAGTVTIGGETARGWRHRAPRAQRTAVGVVFQQPRMAADPKLTLGALLTEPLRACGRGAEARHRGAELAREVGLDEELLGRRPHEVSDGQLQRACLARALVLRPRVLVCDEMTGMLDASTTAALVAVVERYRAASGAALLAVGHDRGLLRRWCDRTLEFESVGGMTDSGSGGLRPRRAKDHPSKGAEHAGTPRPPDTTAPAS